MLWMILSFVFFLVGTALLIRLCGMHKALNDITEQLQEKLHEDTNSLITVSSADSSICGLASKLNEQLHYLRKEQLRLQSGNSELQNAITNVAHDLRTPLTAISGYLELLEMEQLDENPSNYVAVIRERTDALKDLTEELFRYSVINNTADALQAETVSLNDELEIALAAAYQPLASQGITPSIQIPTQNIMRYLDKKALQRIFGNILNNAAKYSAGDLTVSLDTDGTVTFSNSAPTLSEIEVGRLFERFYTVENAKGAMGLGLSIAKLLTEKMGGSICADYINGNFNIIVRFTETCNRIE